MTNRSIGGSSAAPRLVDTAAIGTQRVTLSSRGRTFLTVGLISLASGVMLGVTDLERLGVLLLVLPVPAWLAVRQARSGLRVGHAVTPSRIVVGDQAQVRLVLGNPHSFGTGPLRITETVPGGRPLRFSVAGVRGRQRRTVAYPLPALRRGHYTVGPTNVTASDPFGLVTAETQSTDVGELVVRPQTTRLADLSLPIAWRDGAATLSHSVGSGGSDDASVREYRHGDDLRKIHWRSTARSGAFMVRQEERPWHGESLVLLDHRSLAYPTVPSQPDSAALEWAISAAASIACHLAERGRRVAVVTGDGQVAHDSSPAVLDMLADVKPALRADLEPLTAALTGLGRDAAVFAVLAASPKSSVSGLLTQPRMPGTAVAVLLRPWTWNGDTPDLLAEAAWQSSSETLRAAGWRVVPAQAGDDIAALWPSLLSKRVTSYR